MAWQAFRKKIPFKASFKTPKNVSSSKMDLTIDPEPTTDIPVTTQNVAKILIIGETGSGKLTV